jgi:hypothetical protein
LNFNWLVDLFVCVAVRSWILHTIYQGIPHIF